MSVLKPHLGELLDRYGILCMKIREAMARQPHASVGHFLDEQHAIENKLSAQSRELDILLVQAAMGKWLGVVLYTIELGTLNGQMWEMNKQARQDTRISLKDIHPFNDRRAELVRMLGSLTGPKTIPSDKVY